MHHSSEIESALVISGLFIFIDNCLKNIPDISELYTVSEEKY